MRDKNGSENANDSSGKCQENTGSERLFPDSEFSIDNKECVCALNISVQLCVISSRLLCQCFVDGAGLKRHEINTDSVNNERKTNEIG